MKNLFDNLNKREIQKFNVSLTFSIMRKVISLLGILGIIFAISTSYINNMDLGALVVIVFGILLLVQLFLLPGYIAAYKTSPRTTAIFVLGIIPWLFPLTWPAALVWACTEQNCDREIKVIEKEKYIMFQVISSIIIILISIFFYFGVCHEAVCEARNAKIEISKVEKAVNIYHKEHNKEIEKEYGVSEKCYADYQNIIELEGEVNDKNFPCSDKEKQSIKSYLKQFEQGYDIPEPVWSNDGMPKSLVLKGVPILCFEKANLGDNSKCTKKQLDTIKEFYKNNQELDWEKEYFEY